MAFGLLPEANSRKMRRMVFFGDDFPVTPDRLAVAAELLHNAVAIAKPTASLALLHPTPQAAPRLVGKIFQEQRVHRAFQADMQFADLALGQGDDSDAREFQMLIERRPSA